MTLKKTWIKNAILALLAVAIISPVISGVPSLVTTTFVTTVVFQVAVEIAFVLWFFLMLSDASVRVNWRNPIIFFFLLFVLALVATLPFSSEPFVSFWSTPQRTTGVLHFLHFAAWLVIAAGMLKDWKHWKLALLLTTAVAVGADLVAIGEWWSADSEVLRVHSFFGNALFLAQFITLHIFIALMLWARAKKFKERAIYLVIILLHVFALLLTASRSPILASAIAIFFGTLVLLSTAKSKMKKIYVPVAMLVIVAVCVGGMLFVHSRGLDWAYENLPFSIARIVFPNPLDSSDSFIQDQIADRDNLWFIAFESIIEKPIQGNGIETFRNTFNANLDPTGRDVDLVETGFDRTHNQFIEVLYGAGIIGFLPYMLLWLSVIILCVKAIRSEDDYWNRAMLAFLFMAFIAHAIQLQFLFDLRSATQVFVLLLAFTYWQTSQKSLKIFTKKKDLPVFDPTPIALATMLILVIPLAYFLNIRPFVGYYWNDRAALEFGRDLDFSAELFEKSLDPKTPYSYDGRLIALNMMRSNVDQLGVRVSAFEQMVEMNLRESEVSIADFPGRFSSYHSNVISKRQHAKWYPESAAEDLIVAEDRALKMIELAPGRLEGYEEMGQIELLRENYDAAEDWFLQADERIINDDISHGRIAFRLAEINVRRGDFTAGIENLDRAIELGYGLFFDIQLSQALNSVEEPENIPDGFSFYMVQLFSVQSDRWEFQAEVAKYFLMIEDIESYNLAIGQMHTLDGLRTEQFWWQHRPNVQ